MTSGGDINLKPSNFNVNIPQEIGLTFGNDSQRIVCDSTNNLNINGGKILI